jgi:hypothetical protein
MFKHIIIPITVLLLACLTFYSIVTYKIQHDKVYSDLNKLNHKIQYMEREWNQLTKMIDDLAIMVNGNRTLIEQLWVHHASTYEEKRIEGKIPPEPDVSVAVIKEEVGAGYTQNGNEDGIYSNKIPIDTPIKLIHIRSGNFIHGRIKGKIQDKKSTDQIIAYSPEIGEKLSVYDYKSRVKVQILKEVPIAKSKD